MINIKLTVFAGLAAAVLSLIFGIFGEVTAGAVILRALLSGLVFAGFITGAGILLHQFLPELFEESAPDDDEQEGDEKEAGGKVNIVLDDEDDGAAVGYTYAGAEASGGHTENEVEGNVGGLGRQDRSSEGMEELSAADDVEELEEVEELSSVDSAGGAVPDIGAFENSFNTAPSGLDSLGDAGASGGTSSFDVLGGSHSTTDAAKAIQTILKKEQEG